MAKREMGGGRVRWRESKGGEREIEGERESERERERDQSREMLSSALRKGQIRHL